MTANQLSLISLIALEPADFLVHAFIFFTSVDGKL